MNNKGFTLVELLAVIVLVAILGGLAIPNVVSSINNSRKNTFLLDAKRMVSKAEYLISTNMEDRNTVKSGGSVKYNYNRLNEKGEFQTDSDGQPFNPNTFVKVIKNDNSFSYCICAMGTNRIISQGETVNCSLEENCIDSNDLTSISIVKDIN